MVSDSTEEKVKTLGIDQAGHKFVMYAGGKVTGVKDGKRSVLASPAILEEPGYRYFIDADGDLSRKPKGSPWSPPAVIARELPLEPLKQYVHEPAVAPIRFARLPFESISYYESELLEPERALAAWEAAHAVAGATGLSPIIRTFRIQDHNVEGWQKGLGAVAKERKEAGSLDVRKFFKDREVELNKVFAESASEGDGRADELVIQRAALAALPADKLKRREPQPFHFQTLGQYVVLVLVACEPWELPVCVQFGGWNQVPDPVAQSAVLREWSKQYGTDIVVAGGDFLEMRTTRALTPPELKTAAWDQMVFADDIVFQGTKTVDNLAREISTGRWFFWWD